MTTINKQAENIAKILEANNREHSASVIRSLLQQNADLLEALKRCRFDSLNMSLADLEFCRATIAKVTGEQP